MGAFFGFCSESLDACFQKSGGKSVQKSVHKSVQNSGGASGHYGVQCGSSLNGLVVYSRRFNIPLHVTSQAKDVKTSNKSENLQRFQRLEIYYLGNQSESSAAKSGERKLLHAVFRG